MQLGHAAVVAPEEGEKILRQIILVDFRQSADDAEIQGEVASGFINAMGTGLMIVLAVLILLLSMS